MLGPSTFRLLNLQLECSQAADWHPPEVEKLWIYNLHYFDDLNAEQADSRVAWHVPLLERWVAQLTPGQGDAWQPYPVSRRVVNWVKWAARGHTLSPAMLDSLAAQVRWLVRRLEYHLLGNHLFANAKALLFAGLYFTGEEADSWCARGWSLIERELQEQVLADGGHFELSPMYHAAMLEDVLDLINLQQSYGLPVPASWLQAVHGMLRWARVMNHPDGQISFFNDSAFAIAPELSLLEQYAASLAVSSAKQVAEPLQWLSASGYVRALAGPAYMLCDCGQVGPTYLPGHAHADTLSFELSLYGRRVFVNSGTSQYGLSAERQRQRGTAAHNTVSVDGENSSEVWAGFRVARRARVTVDKMSQQGELLIAARHDGYRRLPGRNEHQRSWSLTVGALRIVDRVTGRFNAADAYFHLHPELRAVLTETNATEVVILARDTEVARMSFEGAGAIELEPGSWHPRFGEAVENICIRARFSAGGLITHVRWAANV